jgi:hypothetical protein
VFAKQKHQKTGAEVLLLVNIGSHEEVYQILFNSGLARQCFCDAISSGETPEGRPAIAEEFCGTGERIKMEEALTQKCFVRTCFSAAIAALWVRV